MFGAYDSLPKRNHYAKKHSDSDDFLFTAWPSPNGGHAGARAQPSHYPVWTVGMGTTGNVLDVSNKGPIASTVGVVVTRNLGPRHRSSFLWAGPTFALEGEDRKPKQPSPLTWAARCDGCSCFAASRIFRGLSMWGVQSTGHGSSQFCGQGAERATTARKPPTASRLGTNGSAARASGPAPGRNIAERMSKPDARCAANNRRTSADVCQCAPR